MVVNKGVRTCSDCVGNCVNLSGLPTEPSPYNNIYIHSAYTKTTHPQTYLIHIIMVDQSTCQRQVRKYITIFQMYM